MSQYDRIYTKLAGALLIAGPALIVCAALLAAAGFGTTTGRWYDNRLEGILLALGFMLQLVGLLELCRRIGASRPVLGIVATLTSVIGSMGAIFPSAVRILGAVELELGITVEQLDAVHGPNSDGTDPLLIVLPFILCFFLNYLLILPLGLWRSKTGPRFSPFLLIAGVFLFILGQGSFVVNMPAYIAGVTAWLLALAPLGLEMLREENNAKRLPMGGIQPGLTEESAGQQNFPAQ
jgi:hypothetical protein